MLGIIISLLSVLMGIQGPEEDGILSMWPESGPELVFEIAGIGNGMLQLIDRDAVMFSPVYGGEILDLPIITGDFKKDCDDRNFKSAFKFLKMIYDYYPVVYKEIGEINYTDNKLSLRLKESGASVIVDDPCREEFLNGLSTFLAQKIDELPVSIDYLDLRYPAMVIAGKED